MSGDVQPRKRKDRRRKKDEGSDVPDLKRRISVEEEPEEAPVHHHHANNNSNASSENIHVHHDHGIGGGVIVKVIFFALLAILLGLVGAIFIESRGSTDVDLPTIEESRFAEYFTGWLDDAPDDHGHDEHEGHEAASGEEEHDDHDEHDEHEEEEHGDHEEETEEEEGHSEEPEESAAATEEQADDEEPEQEVTEEENSAAEIDDDEDSDGDVEDEDEDEASQENDEEDEEVSQENDDEDEEASQENDEEVSEENDDKVSEENDNEEGSEDDEEDFDLTQEDEDDDESRNVVVTKSKKKETLVVASPEDEADAEDDDKSDAKDVKSEENDDKSDVEDVKSDEDDDKSEAGEDDTVVEDSEGVEEIEESEEALKEEEEAVKAEEEVVKKKTLSILVEEEDLEGISDERRRKFKERQLMRKLEKILKEQEAKEEGNEEGKEEGEEDDDAERQETGGVAMKLGVGVALVIVAHMVIVRRWQEISHADGGDSSEQGEPEETPDEQMEEKKEEVVEPVVFRRQTLVPETAKLDEEEEEEYSDEEGIIGAVGKRRTSQDVKLERQDPKKYYTKEELGDSEDFEDEDEEELGEEEEEFEVEEEELLEEEEEYEPEGSQTPSDLDEPEEEEEEEEYEPPVVQRTPVVTLKTPVAPPRRRGSQELDDDEFLNSVEGTEEANIVESEVEDQLVPDEPEPEEEVEEKSRKIDRDDEWLFREDLDFADDRFNLNPQTALDTYDKVLKKNPQVLRALVGRAKVLDKLAELGRSNQLLRDAIDAYYLALSKFGEKLDDKQFRELAARTADRMQFSGRNVLAAEVHQLSSKRFPKEVSHHNAMAVSYLLAGQNKKAQKVLENTLRLWPNDGFAQVHLGFILKTDGALEESIGYLEKGLKSNQTGTMDGRFLFHLGDALQRLGRADEAVGWYELGVAKGIFKSKYQRSLYNVDRLKGRPWWTHDQTSYTSFFKTLENNWKKIREEGLSLLRARDAALFKDEAESLRDTGDWKQMDLFSRGRKQSGCSRAPFTCQLISAFGPASSCTRGQAKFSVMEPGTHVWPHCGPTNCRLRAHLGLVVPQGVYLRVAEEIRSWEEGKVFIFDDSFEHEVWHNGTSLRLVLIVDVWHPELTPKERQTLSPI